MGRSSLTSSTAVAISLAVPAAAGESPGNVKVCLLYALVKWSPPLVSAIPSVAMVTWSDVTWSCWVADDDGALFSLSSSWSGVRGRWFAEVWWWFAEGSEEFTADLTREGMSEEELCSLWVGRQYIKICYMKSLLIKQFSFNELELNILLTGSKFLMLHIIWI